MAILTEYEEASPSSSTKPFNAVLDRSNPLGFLETVFEFLAKETDFFKSDSLANDISAVARRVKNKVDSEDRKRKEKVRESGNAGKKVKEETPSVAVKQEPKASIKEGTKELMKEDKKVAEVKEEGEGKENGSRGMILVFFISQLVKFLFCCHIKVEFSISLLVKFLFSCYPIKLESFISLLVNFLFSCCCSINVEFFVSLLVEFLFSCCPVNGWFSAS